MITLNVWLAIGALAAALILGALASPLFKKARKQFRRQTQTIQSYWRFIVVYALAFCGAYILTYHFSTATWRELNISILNQVTAMIFAIFVGYYAFLQVVESRADRLLQDSDQAIAQNNPIRAQKILEEADKIRPGSYRILSNLCELYLISDNEGSFNERWPDLDRSAEDVSEKIVALQLDTLRYLLKGHLRDATAAMTRCLDFCKSQPNWRLYWQFRELKASKPYSALKSDFKSMTDNFISYLEKNLDPSK